jgi:GNAT superfamily N-acetyltransferase
VLGWGTDRDRAAERIARLLDHPDYHGWLAVDPAPIGFATGQLNRMLQVDAPVAELTGPAVLPDVAGTRVGSQLLAEFETWASDPRSRVGALVPSSTTLLAFDTDSGAGVWRHTNEPPAYELLVLDELLNVANQKARIVTTRLPDN